MKKRLAVEVQAWVERFRREIEKLDVESIARQTKFQRRTARKLDARQFLIGLAGISAWKLPSLAMMATTFGLLIGLSYSKQALCRRIARGADAFVSAIAAQLFKTLARPMADRGVFSTFNRVLVQDSTSVQLPDQFAQIFPGSKNQHRKNKALLKIQLVMDLLSAHLLNFILSGFTRNDQAAATDILDIARPGDLVLRDLGYFTTSCFRQMSEKAIFFLSRYRTRVAVINPSTGKKMNIRKTLKKRRVLDQQVLLGKTERVPVRLVALPVPEPVANKRRRLAHANRDRRSNPSREKLALLGWNIFVLNVSPEVWPTDIVAEIYQLRWRIEIVFKAWKSHLCFAELITRSEHLLKLSVLIKLLFCLIVHSTALAIELLAPAGQHVSLLKISRILKEFSPIITALLIGINPLHLLHHLLSSLVFYESRRDRPNFFHQLARLGVILG